MSRPFKHIFLPILPALSIILLYLLPVSILGCAPRGILAVSVVGVSLIIASVTVVIAILKRIRGQEGSGWWIISTLILMVPAILVVGPLG